MSQLMAQARRFAGCEVETDAAFVAMGEGAAANVSASFSLEGYTIFRVNPLGATNTAPSIGMDAVFAAVPDAAASPLFQAASGATVRLSGHMMVLDGAMDLGSYGRLFRGERVEVVTAASAVAVNTPSPVAASPSVGAPATAVATATPRVALVVEGTLTTPEFQLAIRNALLEAGVSLIPATEVLAARTFVGAGLLTPSTAVVLRERLDADRVLVVQTATVPAATPTAAPAAPARHRHRRHRHGDDAPAVAVAPESVALQVFVADRAGSPPPASRSGEPTQIITEVATLIRALPAARGAAVAAVVTVPSVPGSATAPVGEGPEPATALANPSGVAEGAPPSRMWIDLGFFKGSNFYGLSPEIGFSIRVQQVWSLDFAFPAAFGDRSGNNGLANPVAGLSRWLRAGSGALQAGGLLTIPLTSAVDNFGSRLFLADGMRGSWDGWRWAHGGLAVIGFGRYHWRRDHFDLRSEFAMGLLFPVGDQQDSVQFTAQFGVAPFYRIGERGGIGLDLRGVWRPADDGLFQISMVPRVRFSPGSVDLDFWLNVNINEPLGFAFDDGRVWGFGTTLGFTI